MFKKIYFCNFDGEHCIINCETLVKSELYQKQKRQNKQGVVIGN
jgi:hypothetical protein